MSKKKCIFVAVMKKGWKIALCIGTPILIAAIVIGIGFGVSYYRLEVCNFKSYDGDGHGYYVYPGMSLDSLKTLMQADYKIISEAGWRMDVRRAAFAAPKAGYYRFPAHIGDKHLIRRLQLGQETPVRISWTNAIRTNAGLAHHLAKQLLLDSADVVNLLEDDSYLKPLGFDHETARCMFIPNTYEVYWTISAEQLFNRMYKEYNAFWNDKRRHQADSLGLSPIEVSIVASIVESETHNKKEHPAIASLYLNRLRKGMLLQACPTAIYANGDFKLRRVLKRHLKIDSPYNTYKYPGLPPGPIRCAYGETMDIVLNAPKTDYIYMVANPDFSGTHIFSASYANHARLAKEYQHELNERKIR